MSGPDRPFEGALGLQSLVGGDALATLLAADQPFRILQADMKYYVTEYHSEAPIMMALRLRREFEVSDIAAIHISTYKFAYEEIGSGRSSDRSSGQPKGSRLHRNSRRNPGASERASVRAGRPHSWRIRPCLYRSPGTPSR